MAEREDWERLAAAIDDDEAVREAVLEAFDAGDDPWDALLGGLDEVGALAYLRADDTGMELTDALAQLPRVFAAQPDLGPATDEDHLPDAMSMVDLALRMRGLRVVRLVEEGDDDSWPLVVVPKGSAEAIRALAEGLGGDAVVGG